MKFKAQILAATIAASFMFAGGAEACSIAAWTGTAQGAPVAGDANDANPVKRYSGLCGMKASADNIVSHVTDNNPAADGVYRARMYVFTGSPTATVKFFSATDADNKGGSEVIGIDFDGSKFNFNVGGVAGSSAAVNKNEWYYIELVHSNGKPFKATVQSGKHSTTAQAEIVGASNSAGTVGSASLGVVTPGAGSNTMSFDQFDSTRNETTKIGRLCPGDVNGDGKTDVQDAVPMATEFVSFGSTLAGGQADMTADGVVDVNDAVAAATAFANFNDACPAP